MFILIVYIMLRAWIRQEVPDSRYTPVDRMTGQTSMELREEKGDKAEEDDKGVDVDKNERHGK